MPIFLKLPNMFVFFFILSLSLIDLSLHLWEEAKIRIKVDLLVSIRKLSDILLSWLQSALIALSFLLFENNNSTAMAHHKMRCFESHSSFVAFFFSKHHLPHSFVKMLWSDHCFKELSENDEGRITLL